MRPISQVPLKGRLTVRTPMTSPADERRDRDSALRGFALADVLTIGNGVCGLFAIAVATGLAGAGLGAGRTLDHNRLALCAGLILAGSVLDVADGAAARRWGSSGLGDALDSMCDVLTFGLAPAVMLVAAHDGGPRSWHVLSLLVATSLLVASMVRLARFHAQRTASDGFRGVPMPAAAGVVIALLALSPPVPIELGGVVLVAALMLATFPYPHLDRHTVPVLGLFAALAAICLIGAFPLWPAAVICLVIVGAIPLLDSVPERGLPDRLLGAAQGELSVPPSYRAST